MLKRKPKRPADFNALAAQIVAEAVEPYENDKDQAKVVAGRAGGKKGGKARASSLTAEQRSESAKRAAEARWQKPVDS